MPIRIQSFDGPKHLTPEKAVLWLESRRIGLSFGQAMKLRPFLWSRDTIYGFLDQITFMGDFIVFAANFQHKVVLFNFADDTNAGELLSRTETVQRLKLDRKMRWSGAPSDGVVMYPAFNGVEVEVARALCRDAQKIFICMHGVIHDTNTGFCDSFGYNFFRRICTHRRVRLTARTGMLNFSEQQMCSLVEDEESILAQRDLRELKNSKTRYEIERDEAGVAALKEAYAPYRAYLRYRSNARQREKVPALPATPPVPDPMLNPSDNTEIDEVVRDHARKMYEIFRLTGLIKEPNQPKYGKLVYTYEDRCLEIVSKYAGPEGTPAVLYEGALL